MSYKISERHYVDYTSDVRTLIGRLTILGRSSNEYVLRRLNLLDYDGLNADTCIITADNKGLIYIGVDSKEHKDLWRPNYSIHTYKKLIVVSEKGFVVLTHPDGFVSNNEGWYVNYFASIKNKREKVKISKYLM